MKLGTLVCAVLLLIGLTATGCAEQDPLVKDLQTPHTQVQDPSVQANETTPPPTPAPPKVYPPVTLLITGHGTLHTSVSYTVGTSVYTEDHVTLPWQKTVKGGATHYTIVAKNGAAYGDHISCRIFKADGTAIGHATRTLPSSLVTCDADLKLVK